MAYYWCSGYGVLFLQFINNPFVRTIVDNSDNIDTSTSYVLEHNLLTNKGITESKKELPIEKLYFDGIRLYVLVNQEVYSENSFYIEDAQNPNFVDIVYRMNGGTIILIWNAIQGGAVDKINLIYKEIDSEKISQEILLKNIIKEEKEIKDYFEELYVINYQKGEASIRLKFKLDALSKVSNFRIIQNNYAATGYIVNEEDEVYDIVFPMNIDTTKEFSISVYGEEGIENARIPIKFY